ncbi:hypothetical protein ACL07V_05980 [Streptomyces sp. MB22_4]|uniref:hypothetical protein n=1 Tax=Streptomyces sp. MB22_4 TaxID=3383120 RepID=UPI0039A38014
MAAVTNPHRLGDLGHTRARVSRDDVIEKNPAHVHAADPEYVRRVEAAVPELRED